MKCPVCGNGETYPGTATLTVERGPLTMVVRNVRAQSCDNCGGDYTDEEAARQALGRAEAAARQGITVEVREFVVA